MNRSGLFSLTKEFLLNVVVSVDGDGSGVVSRRHGHVIGDGDGTVKHAGHQSLVVVLSEAIAPLSGLHGELDIVCLLYTSDAADD